MIRSILLFVSILTTIVAECPNACSSHGRCSSYDMCLCYRNWMANDCSERVCQFGLAHVDSPKGDLDASGGKLTGPGINVIDKNEVYPYGTTEQYPDMVDSDGSILKNTGHYYMECSNKGICDRENGVCECFPGYEGSSCQRASCPSNSNGVCSGHGTCETIKNLASNDNDNLYELWDEESTLGCNCDPGYYGPDCSSRRCKYGADPLYADDGVATPRVANFTFGIYNRNFASSLWGNYSIRFHDVFGEDWETDYITHNDTCDDIISRLVKLPNDVIVENSVNCLEQSPGTYSDRSGYHVFKVYTLVFAKNVGVLKQISINMHLDGPRPTLFTDEVNTTLSSFVFADGFHGEFTDYVPDLCEDVKVTIAVGGVLGGLTNAEIKKLKACLGGSDNDETNNVFADVYDWDTGNNDYPHLIKLVEASDRPVFSRICNSTTIYHPQSDLHGWCDNMYPAGFYAALMYRSGEFLLGSRPDLDYDDTTEFHVFTTTGYLKKMTNTSTIFRESVFSNKVTVRHLVNTSRALDCESGTQGNCIDKNDRIMFLDPTNSSFLFKYPNMYTVEKISTRRLPQQHNPSMFNEEVVIDLDVGTNFPNRDNTVETYKFFPPANGGASWANECSERGICMSDTGLCNCFKGYTSDDCSVQNILAQ